VPGLRPQSERNNDLKRLRDELARRTLEPLHDIPFITYITLAIILFGGLGVWVEGFKIIYKILVTNECIEVSSLITSILTYYPAVLGAGCLQLVLSSFNKMDKDMASFGLFVFVGGLLSVVILPFFSEKFPGLVIFSGVVWSIFAVWIWWITNSDDPTFRRMPPPDAASGGDTKRDLSGDLTGVET